jgi:hypothetical protein
MLAWLLSWFRDEEAKKTCPFSISWSKRGRSPISCSGVEISPTQLVFNTAIPPHEKEFDVEFVIRNRILHAHVKAKRPIPVSTPAGLQHKLVCKFLGIPADDWDRIDRFVHDDAEANYEGSFFDPDKPDDDFRSLPMSVQLQIIEDLVRNGKLAAPKPNVAPLIKMVAKGEKKATRGKILRKFMIRSRLVKPDENTVADFETPYIIDDKGMARSVAGGNKKIYSADHVRKPKS